MQGLDDRNCLIYGRGKRFCSSPKGPDRLLLTVIKLGTSQCELEFSVLSIPERL